MASDTAASTAGTAADGAPAATAATCSRVEFGCIQLPYHSIVGAQCAIDGLDWKHTYS